MSEVSTGRHIGRSPTIEDSLNIVGYPQITTSAPLTPGGGTATVPADEPDVVETVTVEAGGKKR